MPDSRRIALMIWFSFFVFGVFEGMLPTHADASSLIHGLILIVGAVFWCSYHAAENELSLPKGSIIFCILLPIFGIPYYLLRGYGLKNGGLKVFWFFFFIAASFVTYLASLELIDFLFR